MKYMNAESYLIIMATPMTITCYKKKTFSPLYFLFLSSLYHERAFAHIPTHQD